MTTDNTSSKKLFLLDAYALMYRSYFAFIRNPRFNSKGLNTSAMLGFTNTLHQVLTSEEPTHIAVVFDVHEPTFRHEMYKEYKANREAMPEDLRKSIPYIRDIIRAFNIPIIEKAGYEADDVIGTIANKAEKDGYAVYMMTPDKDYAQLVGGEKYLYKPKRSGNEAEIWDLDKVNEFFNIERAEQVVDVLGLMGDSSDNIPGCPGIGEKTAKKLIGEFGTIEVLYENIDKLKGKQKEKLVDHKEQVMLSKELVKIIQDVPVEIDFAKMEKSDPDPTLLLKLYNELEFKTLANKLKGDIGKNESALQGSLFDNPVTHEVVEKVNENTIESVEHNYFKVETSSQRASLRAELAVAEAFCFDTETTGLDPHSSEIICVSFAVRPHEAYCLMLPNDAEGKKAVLSEFKAIFEDEDSQKIGQNIKYDILMLANYGIEVKGVLFDTMVAHYLLQPELRHNLDYLCEQYLNYKKVSTESLIGKKGKNQRSMKSVPIEKLIEYACEDADLTLQLKLKFEQELDKNGLEKLFEEIEMPLIPVLMEMEKTGVTIDREALDGFAEKLRKMLSELEKEIHDLAGEEFLITSPKQLGEILFDKLQIDKNAKKTKTKQYQTGEEVLVKLEDKHPIVEKVLEYRGLKKLLNTYVEALPKLINKRTGKIHTSFNQAVAATGRLSSNNPNLQNIPIRDAYGKEIRKAFTTSVSENIFVSADYSQVELRIMASLSEDEALVEAFNKGKDIHAMTAAKIFGVSEKDVTGEMRRKAKTANFGIIYGISAFGLSQRLNIPRKEAAEIIDGYFNAFPKVKEYMDDCIINARESGFVQTLLGRKRYLNDINSANGTVRGVAERNAINAPIQGTAADIIKIAMINIHERLKKSNLKTKMILQVHDELNFDGPENELEDVKKIVSEEMQDAFKLKIPLEVELGYGKNWLEAH